MTKIFSQIPIVLLHVMWLKYQNCISTSALAAQDSNIPESPAVIMALGFVLLLGISQYWGCEAADLLAAPKN